MDIFILVVTSVFNILLGLIVVARDIHKPYTRIFGLMCLFLTGWIIANYVTNHAIENLELVNLANKGTFIGGLASAAAGLIFTYLYPVVRKVSRGEILFVAVLTVLPLALSISEAVAGVATVDTNGSLSFSIGELLWLYVICFLVIIALIARNLFSVSRAESVMQRKQMRLVLTAFSVCAIGGLIFNLLLPVLTGDWAWTKFGPLATVFLVGLIGYTIIKHGLFDIRLAVMRGVAYSLSLTTLAGLYYVLAYAISEVVFHNNTVVLISQNPISILLALLLAFVFQPIKNFFDKLTNRIFFRDEYNTDEFFAKLSRELRGANDLRVVLQRAAHEIGDTMKSEYASFFVRYGNDKHITTGTDTKHHIAADDVHRIEALLPPAHTIVVTDILEEKSELRQLLAKHKIAIVLPLEQGDALLGHLFLGYQKGRSYMKRDIKVLETISDELVIAIQNALSVQEIQDFNETLQQRIQEATKELRTTNSQLQRLDEAKDEFISMASHQLRTPLTSVKGYISMVLEEDAGKITSAQRQLLDEAFASSERMVHLINDFLNVSRLQTGKFMLEQRPIDLSKVVAEEVESLQSTVKMHALKIKYKKPPYFPLLSIDEAKIRQVIMNFIDNAIYYSLEGTTITVTLAIEDAQAVVRVTDTGIGVPQSEQQHLFSKFFRATNARKQRPDGTGVGLFLAKKVIDAHGGSIVFESTEGKGSTFGFRLPIKKLTPKDADGAQ